MKKILQPPQWVDTVIDLLAPAKFAEEITGDLYELFLNDVAQVGRTAANRRYVINGFGFLAKSFFWERSSNNPSNLPTMMNNYFKSAQRSLMAHKGTTIINVMGLVIAIASALAILTVIRFELSFDKFHSKTDNIYRVVRVSGPDRSEFRSGVSYPVPVALEAEFPGLDEVVAMEYFGGANINVLDASGGTVAKFREESGFVLLEPEFFKVFDYKGTGFKWYAGNPEKALTEPMTVVLTRTMSEKYFGDSDPIGRTLQFQKQFDFRVTGIIEDLPANTDFPFKVLMSYASLNVLAGAERLNNWYSVNDSHNTYLVLPEGLSQSDAEEKIAKIHAAHTSKDLYEFRHYVLQKLTDVHYDARFGNFSRRTISRETIVALGIIGAFLLLTGCINYVNLSTAQSALRAKEMALRKVVGSSRKQLMFQHFAETFLTVCVAGLLASILCELLLQNFQDLFNITFAGSNLADPFVLMSLVVIVLVVTLISGTYPSVVISRFSPLTALKNKFSSETLGGMSLRKVLVVVQFTITQMLALSTFVVVKQMYYFQNVNMGFNKEAIITARMPDSSKANVVAEQLRTNPSISDVSFSFTLPSGVERPRSYQDIGNPEANNLTDFQVFEYAPIDDRYLSLFEIKLLAGRNLSMQDSVGNILINQRLSKNLQLGSPEEAVGKELKMGDGKLVTVVGIVDDFYSNSLKETVDNMVMLVNPNDYHTISIKLTSANGDDLQKTVKNLEQIWASAFPDYVLSYGFFDDNIAAFYAQENKYAKLFQLFSAVFMVIGCLGLYGLITFLANRKSKEVAVRKVLGANLGSILLLFSKEYVRLIFLSFVLAAPVAYYFVNDWLNSFANRIDLQWWLFLLPGTSVLLLALLVVSAKSFRAANANPVDTLRYE